MLGTLLKLLVKDKLLHSGKVPVNAELTRNGYCHLHVLCCPLGGAAFNAMQFSKEELLIINIADIR